MTTAYIFSLQANTVGMEKNQTEIKLNTSEEINANVKENGSLYKPVAVVIGASSGIGFELANLLLSKGYTVINVSRGLAKNERIKNITADITQGEELEHALQAVGVEYGYISLLIYSAGFSMAAPVETAKEADVRYLFEVNYFGAVRAVRTALPYMKKNGGKIFLMGSLGSSYPIPFESFYSSSKAALDMLVKGLRIELKPYRITLTTVQPGGTSTSFTFKRKIYSQEENGEYAKEVNKAVAALANIEQGGMAPQAVAEEVLAEILKKNPAITLVPGGRNKTYRMMSRWLPEKWTEYLNNKKYNQ